MLRPGFGRACALAAASAALLVTAVPAAAHVDSRLNDDGAINSGKETHRHDAQHGGDEGHLPATSKNVQVVGRVDVADGPGRTADVSAKGNFAYLTRYYEPVCSTGGIDVVDISDPAAPKKVSTITSHTDTYSGEGSQVVSLSTPAFKGDVLIYNNEMCGDQGVGGVTLVDVTNPRAPKKLVEGFGDFTIKGSSQRKSNEVHSAFAWQQGSKAYAVLVDNEEGEDVDIIDITNPSRPTFVRGYDLREASQQPLGAVHGDAAFLHDMVVEQQGTRQIMLASYWDGGYVKLDVTDPASARVIGDTDFASLDPVRLDYGQSVSPEGNGHQAEFTRDDKWFLATDEDFDPYRVTATITSTGHAFTAVQGDEVPRIDADTSLAGPTQFAGRACAALPAGSGTGKVAVIERGVCDFTVKVGNVEAAGYTGAIIFNRPGVDGCEALINMAVSGGIPAVFVSRTDGFRILGLAPRDCQTTTDVPLDHPVGAAGEPVSIRAIFDGWGYVHQYDATTMQEVDAYALPEGQNAAYADGFGDLSVHEVATDPDANLAYLSYYAGGFRVLKYGAGGMTEAGRFIAEGGNNFWGVEVHKHPNGQKYILASDRDSGLWIFQYTGR